MPSYLTHKKEYRGTGGSYDMKPRIQLKRGDHGETHNLILNRRFELSIYDRSPLISNGLQYVLYWRNWSNFPCMRYSNDTATVNTLQIQEAIDRWKNALWLVELHQIKSIYKYTTEKILRKLLQSDKSKYNHSIHRHKMHRLPVYSEWVICEAENYREKLFKRTFLSRITIGSSSRSDLSLAGTSRE